MVGHIVALYVAIFMGLICLATTCVALYLTIVNQITWGLLKLLRTFTFVSAAVGVVAYITSYNLPGSF